MKMAIEEPIGPCPCKGTLCNKGFGWIMGKMSDLRGGFHSSKHNVAICSEFPDDRGELRLVRAMNAVVFASGLEMSKKSSRRSRLRVTRRTVC